MRGNKMDAASPTMSEDFQSGYRRPHGGKYQDSHRLGHTVDQELSMNVKGRDFITGLPRSTEIKQ